MFKKFFFTFFLLFISLITIYPSKKENNNLTDYCYAFEKILSRNSLIKNKKVSKQFKYFARDVTLFSTKQTKGAFLNKVIDKYKNSKKIPLIKYVPNKIYCFIGYWIEQANPGTFQSLLYEKSKQRINQYKDIKQEVDEYIKNINSEYKSINEEIKNLF